MHHRWDDVTFLHWPCPPQQAQRLLPVGLEVDTFDGSAWVSLVPFVLTVRIEGVPGTWTFPETNVRTYATTSDGVPAIWFLSLDAARVAAVLGGRAYGLPYMWARMRTSRIGTVRSYRSERRRPHAPASAQVVVEVGEQCDGDELDHFLVDRWALFAERRGRLGVTLATHDPWPLHNARVLSLSQNLTPVPGLPARVHHSPGVAVRVGRWDLR
ncbi:MAG: uncharacterized protein QOG87_3626 [Actinomycetota bacterium]|jgi:uncharacterized protein YqjF (DUF2071 family)